MLSFSYRDDTGAKTAPIQPNPQLVRVPQLDKLYVAGLFYSSRAPVIEFESTRFVWNQSDQLEEQAERFVPEYANSQPSFLYIYTSPSQQVLILHVMKHRLQSITRATLVSNKLFADEHSLIDSIGVRSKLERDRREIEERLDALRVDLRAAEDELEVVSAKQIPILAVVYNADPEIDRFNKQPDPQRERIHTIQKPPRAVKPNRRRVKTPVPSSPDSNKEPTVQELSGDDEVAELSDS